MKVSGNLVFSNGQTATGPKQCKQKIIIKSRAKYLEVLYKYRKSYFYSTPVKYARAVVKHNAGNKFYSLKFDDLQQYYKQTKQSAL